MRMLVMAAFGLISMQALPQSGQPGVGTWPEKSISTRDLEKLETKYGQLSNILQRQSLQLLNSLQQEEVSLEQSLQKIAATPDQALNSSSAIYRQLKEKLLAKADPGNLHPLTEYIPRADSLQTALQFLQTSKLSSLSPAQIQSLQAINGQLAGLQNQLQQANAVTAFVQQRQQQWQDRLQQYNLGSKLAGYKQRAYYYEEQVGQYKALLGDPDKMSGKILGAVRNIPAFQKYMQRNSYLSTLFRVPGSTSDSNRTGTAGLQTRDQVSALVAERMGPGVSFADAATGDNNTGNNPISGSMQQAQDKMNALKDKILQSGGSSSDATMPDFQPNSQHNKTFLKRIRVSYDMQTQQSSQFIPALSTLGLNLGYKLDEKSVIGVGGAYQLGWGQPFNHVAFSGQGASIRSFLDWKLKGSLWICGGYEMNYLNAFTRVAQLRNIDAWQRSGLLGLMKTYKAGKQQGNIQLLYDLLHAEHIPQSPALLFRAGYSFN